MKYKIVKTTTYYSLDEFMAIICNSRGQCKNCPLKEDAECLKANYITAEHVFKDKEKLSQLETKIHERLERYFAKRSVGPFHYELLYEEDK